MNLAKFSVYDNNTQTVFVLLGDTGREWTWKHASELVDNYFEVTRSTENTLPVH